MQEPSESHPLPIMTTTERLLLSVLKYLGPKSVLLQCSLTCHSWLKASSSNELWIFFTEVSDYPTEPHPPSSHWKTNFRALVTANRIACFPVVSGTYLWLFSCDQRDFVQRMPVKYDHTWSSVAMVSNTDVLVSGGHGLILSASATLYHFSSASHEDLPNMSQSRANHCSVYYRKAVYVFGGSCLSAEKLSVTCKRWCALPSPLSFKSHTSASLLEAHIYLFGGSLDQCELFDVRKNSYSLLSLGVSLHNVLCSFAYNDQIFIVKKKKWRMLRRFHVVSTMSAGKRRLGAGKRGSLGVLGTRWYVWEEASQRVVAFDLQRMFVVSMHYCPPPQWRPH